MEVIFGEGEIKNESDVEQKQLYPILRGILRYNPNEILTKTYLEPRDIGKDRKQIKGYYPDYGVLILGFLTIVAEAKNPSESVEKGYADAGLYALEINKRFPKGINPVSTIIASNGKLILAGQWDTEPEYYLRESDFFEGSDQLETFRNIFGKETVMKGIMKLREELFPTKWWKPLKLMGGPTRRNIELPPNEFAKELAPLLTNYFDPDYIHGREEILSKAYISTVETTRYDEILESLLRDNVDKLRTPGALDITTTETEAYEFSDFLEALSENRGLITPHFLLIIGGVGVGKSMFIDRFFEYLIIPEIEKGLIISKIDFNKAPTELENVDEWICKNFVRDLRRRLGLKESITYDELTLYFEREIKERKEGPYKQLALEQPEEVTRRIADDLREWTDDPKLLVHAITRYYLNKEAKLIIGIFDNVDKRTKDQQIKVFEAVRTYREFNNCFCILALRDETYDGYKDRPPLDTILPTNIFRISPPRFIDVIAKRLELVIKDISSRAEDKLSFTVPRGITFTYPNTNLGKYLKIIFSSIFPRERKIRIILEALAGRNVRTALQMFSKILMSSFVPPDRLIKIVEGDGFLPDGIILRGLMRTSFRYFADSHGYTQNIFWLDEKSRTMNNFILIEILNFLSSKRKFIFDLKIEGYILMKDIFFGLNKFGYSEEDILTGLNVILKKGLIVTENQKTSGINEDDYVRITASGYFHLRTLPDYLEYSSSVALDTWFSDSEIAKNISHRPRDNFNSTYVRFKYLDRYILSEFIRVSKVFPAYAEPTSGIYDIINHRFKACNDFINRIKIKFEKNK